MDATLTANLPLLKKIYGETTIAQQEETIDRLFMQTETSWHTNLNRLQGREIKHILITEAPCTKGSETEYFYNRIESSFHKKIWKALYPDTDLPTDMETAYALLAQKDFLLVDSIPFSLKFSGKRDKKAYTDLMLNSVEVLKDKLNNPKLTISPNAVVAFAFKVNAQKMIEATGGKLALKNGQQLTLSEDSIAADASGYTNSALLRQIFGL